MTVWAIILSALALGFAGSLHCVGMCGPIALMMPVSAQDKSSRFKHLFLYLFGKSTTYSLLGVGMGLFGAALQMAGLQQILSVVLGIILIAVVIVMLTKRRLFHQNAATAAISNFVLKRFGTFIHSQSSATPFLMGLFNGLLPCGLVYIGLTAAVALGSVPHAALFMWCFGMGTMPLLAAFVLMAKQFGHSFQRLLRPLTPILLVLMGTMLILRGFHIHVPGLVPATHVLSGAANTNAVDCGP